MNKIINVKFLNDELLETLRSNTDKVSDYLINNPVDSSWLSEFYAGEPFVDKKYKISDFDLKLSKSGKYNEVDFENSIILYEALKDLPRHILTDERFWGWINLTKGYKASLQAMPISKSVVKDHWLFNGSRRRGLFFGVMSRCYLRVELTIKDNWKSEEKYKYTKFIIEKPERFRNLTWRSFSNKKHIVIGIIRAEYDINKKYGKKLKNKMFSDLAKEISVYASTKLIDIIPEEEVYQHSYKYLEDKIKTEPSMLVKIFKK